MFSVTNNYFLSPFAVYFKLCYACCIYTEIQPGEILPGLCSADAPEARGRKAAEKIPTNYAVNPLNRPP